VDVHDGLGRTVAWFRERPGRVAATAESVAGAQFEGDSQQTEPTPVE
jgi:hypothetical protein